MRAFAVLDDVGSAVGQRRPTDSFAFQSRSIAQVWMRSSSCPSGKW